MGRAASAKALSLEASLIDWLCRTLPRSAHLLIGPGDDAALLKWTADRDCVVTTDVLMDQVDFELDHVDPRRVGRKALAVNLSDLAAMAARPKAALVGLVLPRSGGEQLAHDLFAGIIPLAEEFGVAIAGGDINSWDGRLVISITAIGEGTPDSVWKRSGARPGDAIVVTGQFGGSIHGRHFDFQPRVKEALCLAEHYEVHAAIDVSDGLSLDLSRMASASGCGFEIEAARIPISDAARQSVKTPDTDNAALRHALEDGEDFELILAMPPHEAERLLSEQPLAVAVSRIGRFVSQPDFILIDARGSRAILIPGGYEHRFDS